MSVKKAYQDVVEYLSENANCKVSTILPTVIEMCSAKSGGGVAETVKRDEEGNVVAVFCYYHKEWEDPSVVAFGAKATSSTGLSNMCKEGTSNWTKQQREAKKASAELLDKVASGEVEPGDISAIQEEIDEQRKRIIPREDGHALTIE